MSFLTTDSDQKKQPLYFFWAISLLICVRRGWEEYEAVLPAPFASFAFAIPPTF